MPFERSTTRNIMFNLHCLYTCKALFSAMSQPTFNVTVSGGGNALTGILYLGMLQTLMQFKKL